MSVGLYRIFPLHLEMLKQELHQSSSVLFSSIWVLMAIGWAGEGGGGDTQRLLYKLF